MACLNFTMSIVLVERLNKTPQMVSMEYLKVNLLTFMTVGGRKKIQMAGAWHSCGSSGNTFCVSQSVFSSMVSSSTHNFYTSFQGTQDMYIKKDSKVEAISHFMSYKSL